MTSKKCTACCKDLKDELFEDMDVCYACNWESLGHFKALEERETERKKHE